MKWQAIQAEVYVDAVRCAVEVLATSDAGQRQVATETWLKG